MLGRRAAVAAATVVAAVTGGGVALAANHGSSNSSKPATHATSKHYAGPRSMRSHGSGNCPNMGGAVLLERVRDALRPATSSRAPDACAGRPRHQASS